MMLTFLNAVVPQTHLFALYLLSASHNSALACSVHTMQQNLEPLSLNLEPLSLLLNKLLSGKVCTQVFTIRFQLVGKYDVFIHTCHLHSWVTCMSDICTS